MRNPVAQVETQAESRCFTPVSCACAHVGYPPAFHPYFGMGATNPRQGGRHCPLAQHQVAEALILHTKEGPLVLPWYRPGTCGWPICARMGCQKRRPSAPGLKRCPASVPLWPIHAHICASLSTTSAECTRSGASLTEKVCNLWPCEHCQGEAMVAVLHGKERLQAPMLAAWCKTL